MKTHSLLFSFFMFLLLLGACSSGPVMRNSTGFAYEIVVVMDKADWNAPAGEAIKAEITSDVPGLVQSEPAFKVTYSTPDQFNGLLTYVRNILIVKIDKSIYTKVSLKSEMNRYAKNQAILVLTAPSAEEILKYVEENPRTIVNFFSKVEANRVITLLQKEYSTLVKEKLQKKYDIALNVPADMTYYRDTTDFFWASNNAKTGRTDLIVYSFPYTDPNTFTPEYLMAKRDSVLKVNLPGAFPDSYMKTQPIGITYTPISVDGKYAGELRGLWEMQGDMMGGPFVSHARLDEKNKRVIVAEGFVFAPETDKRNFIRRIEAALYTLRMSGETADELGEPLNVPEED